MSDGLAVGPARATLTLFSTPKAFTGEFETIQRNALRSWTLLRPACDIVLLGDETCTASHAAAHGAQHIASLERSSHGTPLVNAMFERVTADARTDLVGYVNSDIILMSDFMAAVGRTAARFPRFLLVGQRRNVRIETPLDFDGPWEHTLRELAKSGDACYPGIDYFVFPRELWSAIPPFALGRSYWDNWPLYAARRRGAVVVDGTPAVLAVHQDHTYYPGQLQGEESKRNWDLAGGAGNLLTTREATHVLTAQGIKTRCRSCYPSCACADSWGAPRDWTRM